MNIWNSTVLSFDREQSWNFNKANPHTNLTLQSEPKHGLNCKQVLEYSWDEQ